MMRYQLTGLDAKPVQTDLGYAFVQAGAWILVEDSAIDGELSADGHRQPWDYQEVAVVRRGRVVVVVDKREPALGRKIAKVSQGSVDAVRRHWPRPWNGAVMVVAMAEPRVMALLWTSGSGSGWTIAAKAVTLYDGEPIESPFLSSVQPGIYLKLSRTRRTLATYPYQAWNEITRWFFRGAAYLRFKLLREAKRQKP